MALEARIRQLRERPTPPNEESTKAQVILPILTHLGWPSDDPEHVLFEYVAGKGRVDIALRTGGRIVAFIEAKAPGKSLGDHVTQMLNYAFHEGVDICVLTTGLEWWLFLPREKGPPLDRRFAVLTIGQVSAREFAERIFRFLGREALAGQGAERSAKEALNALREEKRLKTVVPQVWRKMKAGPDPELVKLIQKRVKEKTALYPTSSQVAKTLGMVEPVMPEPETGGSTPDLGLDSDTGTKKEGSPLVHPQPVEPAPKPKEAKKARRTPIRSYRLWGNEAPVKFWRDMLRGVVEALHTRHEAEFLEIARPVWGKYSPWISATPDELRHANAIGQSGLYVEGHLSARDIRKRCYRLLEAFGYPATDLEILQD